MLWAMSLMRFNTFSPFFTPKFQFTYLLKTKRTLHFMDKMKPVDHINLKFSGIHIQFMHKFSCKFDSDNKRNYTATAMILLKHTNLDTIWFLWKVTYNDFGCWEESFEHILWKLHFNLMYLTFLYVFVTLVLFSVKLLYANSKSLC